MRLMDMRNLNDQALLDELHTAHNDIVEYGKKNTVISQAAWQTVVDATRELERRYPPEPTGHPLTTASDRDAP